MAVAYNTKSELNKRSLLNLNNQSKGPNAEDYELELENDSFLDQVGPN